MTGYELRRHLIQMHNIVMWGASYDVLVTRHDVAHNDPEDVTHDHLDGGDA